MVIIILKLRLVGAVLHAGRAAGHQAGRRQDDQQNRYESFHAYYLQKFYFPLS